MWFLLVQMNLNCIAYGCVEISYLLFNVGPWSNLALNQINTVTFQHTWLK